MIQCAAGLHVPPFYQRSVLCFHCYFMGRKMNCKVSTILCPSYLEVTPGEKEKEAPASKACASFSLYPLPTVSYSFLSVTLSVKSFHAFPRKAVAATTPPRASIRSRNPSTSIRSPPGKLTNIMLCLHYSTYVLILLYYFQIFYFSSLYFYIIFPKLFSIFTHKLSL